MVVSTEFQVEIHLPSFSPTVGTWSPKQPLFFHRSSVFHTQFFHGKDVEIIIQVKRWHFLKRMALSRYIQKHRFSMHPFINGCFNWMTVNHYMKMVGNHQTSIHFKTGWLPGTIIYIYIYRYTWYPQQPCFFLVVSILMMGTPNL